jgi:predicted DCC family thiol-disulfide oxidoreductase YuxK
VAVEKQQKFFGHVFQFLLKGLSEMKKIIAFPLTIYFDGSCRLCRSEIENIAARDLLHRLQLVDCSALAFDASSFPFSQTELMNNIAAQDATGAWLRGIDVFIAAYEAADLSWVSNVLAASGVKPLAERGYPWLVRNRYRISALGLHHILNFFTHRAQKRRAQAALLRTQSCRDGACDVSPKSETAQHAR